MNLLDQLNWRYATKEFDPEKQLTETQLNTLLESLRLAPSSFGLQTWHFVVVEDREKRAELVPHCWGQPQVSDASHLLVLCAPTKLEEADIDRFLASTAEARGQKIEELKVYGEMMHGFLKAMDDTATAAWMKNQVYLALGSLLTCCAIEKIDACPMEGFLPQEIDKALGLSERGLTPVVLCPIGFRKDSDKYAEAPKVRYPTTDVITHL